MLIIDALCLVIYVLRLLPKSPLQANKAKQQGPGHPATADQADRISHLDP
jgi:hypothetical protein